ncbi:hypothetical protein IMCC9480_3055 [Oxalobacteraceae bacterium IMCC9480]|nr:hypothetical protein IMCC9480_3055 [Oxalobacteraceae bacterium IMCC9480]
MDPNGIVNIPTITTGHRNSHRNAALPGGFEHHPVALCQTLEGQFHASQPIAFVRVGTGQKNNQLRVKARKQRCQRAGQRLQVGRIADIIRQADIEITDRFLKRVVAFTVQRQREHRVVARKNLGSAISLMDIQVHDRNTAGPPFRLHQARGNGRIIEDAKSFAMRRMRMMRATGQVHRNAILERRATGSDGGTGGPPRTLDHAGRPRKTDAFLLFIRQLTSADLADVVRMMRQRQHAITDIRGFSEVDAGRDAGSAFAQQAVLLHRKTVSGRQRQNKMVAVKSFQGADVRKKCVPSLASAWRHRTRPTVDQFT